MNYFFKNYITINTKLGKIKGIHNKIKNKDLFTFYQIPYALPPIKSLRWKYPILWKQKFTNIYDATIYSKIPFQHLYYYYKYYNKFSYNCFIKKFKYKQTEDCLYLDIYSPTIERLNYPVVVCIYGGHYQYGYSRNLRINKEFQNNIIYITINYRIGIFGFFQHPELRNENTFGNYGIADIICALQWIKLNITHFGGDPNNITLQGQGSGANIILFLMTNKICNEQKLFHKSIIHSPAKFYEPKNMCKLSIEISDLLVGQGGNQILRLRNLDDNIINNFYNNFKNINKLFMPNIDNLIIYNSPIILFKNNLQMKIPMIIGFNYDDGKLLYDCDFNNLITLPKFNNNYSKLDIINLNEIYNNINNNKLSSIKRYFTDFMYLHYNKLIAEYHTKSADTFFYILKLININKLKLSCCFELELLYFFNNNNSYNINIDEQLKIKILNYTHNFIITGLPNNSNNSNNLINKVFWKEFENELAIYFNTEIYMNFFNEYQSLIIMNKNYKFIKQK